MPELHTTRRVTRAEPCPICKRANWCRVARDGSYSICNRVESARPAKSGGGWVHRLTNSAPPSYSGGWPDRRAAEQSSVPIAPIDRRDLAYRRLQALSPPRERDVADLLRRGFSFEEIAKRGYGSLRQMGRMRLAQKCHNGQADFLAGVPGFYVAGENHEGKAWSIAGRVGLLIPCRDALGRIRGYRIRPDDPGEDGGKYRWLSSGRKPGGTGSGAHCHVARPLSSELLDRAAWIVEGEIKADVASERLGAVVLSIPGAALWAKALGDLAELQPAGGPVVVALDADWREKSQVHAAAWELPLACQALGYATEVALWDMTYKGLDDLLTAGLHPRRTAPAEMPAPAWVPKVSSRILAEAPVGMEPACLTLAELRSRLPEILGGLCLCR